jgi:hypothetical protein
MFCGAPHAFSGYCRGRLNGTMGTASEDRERPGAEEEVMATQPVMLEPRVARVAFWERFQHEMEFRVRECNAIAGEPLWVISGTGGSPVRFRVESAARSGDRIDCSFDLERGVLVCAPGPGVRARRLRFQWVDGKLLRDGREYDVEQALRLVLDELVCIDED